MWISSLFFAVVGILGILAGLKQIPWFEKHVEVHGAKERKLRITLVVCGVVVLASSILQICMRVFWFS